MGSSPAVAGAALLRTSGDLAILGSDAHRARMVDTRTGAELEVSALAAELLLSFSVPSRLEAGIARVCGRPPRPRPGRARTVAEQLLAAGLLGRYEPEGARKPEGAGGMFGCPLLTFSEVLGGDQAAVVFLGMPYDLGVSHRSGARGAPDVLRRHSGAVFRYRVEDGTPTGAWDPLSGQAVLPGVRLADAGNVAGAVMRQNGPPFDTLTRSLEALGRRGILPVVLGGDHSVSYAAIRGSLAAHGRIGVLQLDAHTDYGGPPQGEWRERLHHGNFMSWVVHDERVALVCQYGARQLERSRPRWPSKLRVCAGTRAAHLEPEALLRDLDPALPYHLTIDVDCLDPTVLPSTGTPVPGGFSREQLITLVTLLCRKRRIVSLDLTEFLPGDRDCDAQFLDELLLRAIDAATAGR